MPLHTWLCSSSASSHLWLHVLGGTMAPVTSEELMC